MLLDSWDPRAKTKQTLYDNYDSVTHHNVCKVLMYRRLLPRISVLVVGRALALL
jgi:hypothetical protein